MTRARSDESPVSIVGTPKDNRVTITYFYLKREQATPVWRDVEYEITGNSFTFDGKAYAAPDANTSTYKLRAKVSYDGMTKQYTVLLTVHKTD